MKSTLFYSSIILVLLASGCSMHRYGACESKSKNSEQNTISSALERAGRLTSKKYIYSTQIAETKYSSSENLQWNEKNADALITSILLSAGFARVQSATENQYSVVELRNIVDSPLPSFEASYDAIPNFPETSDVVLVKYKMKDAVMAREVQRFLTDFVPRYARVNLLPDSDTLLITDSIPNMKKVLNVLRGNDHVYSKEALKNLRSNKSK